MHRLFRNSISQAEKFAYDTEYVENLSFLLDVRVLVATFATVALRRDVFTNVTSSRREI